MINSNERKLSLSGWLLANNPKAFYSPLKMQKFLFLYECFSKVNGENADFSYLKGYVHGPVFSSVWGDYTKERNDFCARAATSYENDMQAINGERVAKSSFIVSVLNENELSELTHALNIWNCKKDRILSGEYQVELSESDFTENDTTIISKLETMFPSDVVFNSELLYSQDKTFLVKRADLPRLTATHMDTLATLAKYENENLHNPVFVEIDDEGGLVID